MSLAVAASTVSKLLADGCHCRRGLDPQQTRGSVPRCHDRNLADLGPPRVVFVAMDHGPAFLEASARKPAGFRGHGRPCCHLRPLSPAMVNRAGFLGGILAWITRL